MPMPRSKAEQREKRCYIYTRVSTEMQVDGFSLDAQRDALAAHARKEGMIIVHEYSDEGKSGKNVVGRPAFQEMMRDIADGKDDVGYVLVYKLSRFGRNTADILQNIELMQSCGAELWSVSDNVNSADMTGQVMIPIMSAFSQMERENIRAQTIGCMINSRAMVNRIDFAADAGVPITNYGVVLAYVNGILDRVKEIFIK